MGRTSTGSVFAWSGMKCERWSRCACSCAHLEQRIRGRLDKGAHEAQLHAVCFEEQVLRCQQTDLQRQQMREQPASSLYNGRSAKRDPARLGIGDLH